MAQAFQRSAHHACIISAPEARSALEAAKSAAADIMCTSGGGKACMQCRSCRKIKENIHPDVIFVRRETDDKGKEKKEIGIDQIRAVVADACVLPHESEEKVYIIDEADRMNVPAQNAALKLLEEPPEHVHLLLCTSNASRLLPTVRSRCVEINVTGERQADEEQTKPAMEYLSMVATGNRAELCRLMYSMEMNGAECEAFLSRAMELAADMLCGRREDMGIGHGQLMKICRLLERCIGYTKVNTGTKHIFALLAASSIERAGGR